jgi:hypothetical protein
MVGPGEEYSCLYCGWHRSQLNSVCQTKSTGPRAYQLREGR